MLKVLYTLLPISTLEYTVPIAADYTCSGFLSSTIQAHRMPGTQFITWWGDIKATEEQISCNSVLKKSGQLPTFCQQRELKPQPQDYQTDTTDLATVGGYFLV